MIEIKINFIQEDQAVIFGKTIKVNLQKANKYIIESGWVRLLMVPEKYSLPSLDESIEVIRYFNLKTSTIFPSMLYFLFDEVNGYNTFLLFSFVISTILSVIVNVVLQSFRYHSLLFWFFVNFALIPSIFMLIAINRTKRYLKHMLVYRNLKVHKLISKRYILY